MQPHYACITRSGGRPAAGAYIAVRNESDGSLATIYSDDGVTVQANPITTGSDGCFKFFAADGKYDVTVSGNGVVTKTYPVLLEDQAAAIAAAATSAALAATGGSALVGHGADTVASVLDARRLFAAQQDYVRYIATRCKPTKMRLSRVSTPYDAIRISYLSGFQHVSHEIKKDAADDWYMYHVGYAGDMGLTSIINVNGSSFVGAWTAADASNNRYTTTIGDYFDVTVTGDTIEMHHLSDNRGGIFEAVIDGDTANPITYSTYGTLVAAVGKVIATGLSNTAHSVRCTFKGADPDNPPSGGTARGWSMDGYSAGTNRFRYTASGGRAFGEAYNSGNNKICLGYASNKEFALNITHNGVNNWFPEHNSVGTAVKLADPYVLIDGVRVELADLVTDRLYEASRIEFVQSATCRFPSTAVDILRCDCSFIFQSDGIVCVDGKMEFLQACTVVNGYAMMFPLWGASVKEFVTGIGNRMISAGDESNQYFAAEKDQNFSACGVDSRNPTLISAVTVDNPISTFRYGKSGRQADNLFTLVWNRATAPKLYFHSFKDAAIPAGEIYKFSGRYAIGQFQNAYKVVP